MRPLFALLLLTTAAFAQTPAAQLDADDAVRIREFYRLASQIQNQIWPDWSWMVRGPVVASGGAHNEMEGSNSADRHEKPTFSQELPPFIQADMYTP
jgi:hypothetical protein